jgi:hypothetical protein
MGGAVPCGPERTRTPFNSVSCRKLYRRSRGGGCHFGISTAGWPVKPIRRTKPPHRTETPPNSTHARSRYRRFFEFENATRMYDRDNRCHQNPETGSIASVFLAVAAAGSTRSSTRHLGSSRGAPATRNARRDPSGQPPLGSGRKPSAPEPGGRHFEEFEAAGGKFKRVEHP